MNPDELTAKLLIPKTGHAKQVELYAQIQCSK